MLPTRPPAAALGRRLQGRGRGRLHRAIGSRYRLAVGALSCPPWNPGTLRPAPQRWGFFVPRRELPRNSPALVSGIGQTEIGLLFLTADRPCRFYLLPLQARQRSYLLAPRIAKERVAFSFQEGPHVKVLKTLEKASRRFREKE